MTAPEALLENPTDWSVCLLSLASEAALNRTALLSIFPLALVVVACMAEPSPNEDTDGAEDTNTAESAVSCRDLSGTYRVAATCWLGSGDAATGTPVTVAQAPDCSSVTFTARVAVPAARPPSPSGPRNPYDMCALACFDRGSHGGLGRLPPGCVCGAPPPPTPPPTFQTITVTKARSAIKDWSRSRIDVDRCALIWKSGP